MNNQFSPGLTMIPYSMDRVEFRRGVWNAESTILEDDDATGTLWPVLDLLNQGCEPSEIVSKIPGLTRGALDDVVSHLITIGVLVQEDAESGSSVKAVRSVWVFSDEAALSDQIRWILDEEGLQVTVIDNDTQPSSQLFASLHLGESTDELLMEQQALEVASARDTAADPFLIVALAQNNPAMLRTLDLLARRAGLAWLHAVVDGPALYVGPFIVPGVTASYRTFEQRVAMNLRERQSYLSWMRAAAADKVKTGSSAMRASARTLLAAHTAYEAANIARGGLYATRNKVLSVYLPTMEIAFNDVLPMAKFDAASQFDAAPDLYYDIREWLVGDER